MNNTQEIAQFIVDNCIVIDTETTGLGENDVVIELAAIRIKTGEVLVDELIKPEWLISPAAEKVHGISHDEAQNQGVNFGKAWDSLGLKSYGDGEYITAFNLVFDERLVRQTDYRVLNPSSIPPFPKPDGIICIMELANRHFAKDHAEWDSEQSRFRRLSLARCCEIAGIEFEGQAHRALSDAKAAADLVTAIAEGRV